MTDPYSKKLKSSLYEGWVTISGAPVLIDKTGGIVGSGDTAHKLRGGVSPAKREEYKRKAVVRDRETRRSKRAALDLRTARKSGEYTKAQLRAMGKSKRAAIAKSRDSDTVGVSGGIPEPLKTPRKHPNPGGLPFKPYKSATASKSQAQRADGELQDAQREWRKALGGTKEKKEAYQRMRKAEETAKAAKNHYLTVTKDLATGRGPGGEQRARDVADIGDWTRMRNPPRRQVIAGELRYKEAAPLMRGVKRDRTTIAKYEAQLKASPDNARVKANLDRAKQRMEGRLVKLRKLEAEHKDPFGLKGYVPGKSPGIQKDKKLADRINKLDPSRVSRAEGTRQLRTQARMRDRLAKVEKERDDQLVALWKEARAKIAKEPAQKAKAAASDKWAKKAAGFEGEMSATNRAMAKERENYKTAMRATIKAKKTSDIAKFRLERGGDWRDKAYAKKTAAAYAAASDNEKKAKRAWWEAQSANGDANLRAEITHKKTVKSALRAYNKALDEAAKSSVVSRGLRASVGEVATDIKATNKLEAATKRLDAARKKQKAFEKVSDSMRRSRDGDPTV